jgi:outer membrane protein assembly factor BamD (BamD/ComL family)
VNKSIELIQNKNFVSAEEIIDGLYKKAPNSPEVLMVKSKLFGHNEYLKYNIDSCYIFYSKSVVEIKKLELKEQNEICSNYKICLASSSYIKDSIAEIAFEHYKSKNSIDEMRHFNLIYFETSYIQSSNNFIEFLFLEKAKNTNTVASYYEFLKMYPNSSKESEIMSKIHKIEYDFVVSKNEISTYQDYLEDYPESIYCNDVKKKIEVLYYEKTIKSISIKDFEDFLNNYPNSTYVKQIKDVYETPYFEKVNSDHTINSYKKFKIQYPNSKYLNQINSSICEIAFEDVEKINTRVAYKDFLVLYPNSKYEEVVKKKILELFPIIPKLKSNGKYICIDKYTGKDLFGIEYDDISLFTNNQSIVKLNGKFGVIDENGKKIIPILYDAVSICTNSNFYLVSNSERFGLYNNEGKKLINVEYQISFISEYYFGFNNYGKEHDGSHPDYIYRIIDKDLETYKCPYDEIPEYSNGIAIVSKGNDTENGKLGLYAIIDKYNNVLVPLKYNYIEPVSYDNNSNLFFFNVGGEADFEYRTDSFYPYSGKWGVINIEGKVIIPAVFDELHTLYFPNDSTKLFFVANRGREFNAEKGEFVTGKCGLLDKSGNEVIPFEYQGIYFGGNDKLIVNKNGVVDQNIASEYDIIGGKWGVINYTNKLVVPITNDEISLFRNNFIVRKGSKYNEYGECIGGKFGLLSSENKIIIPPTYDYIGTYSSDNLLSVSNGCHFEQESIDKMCVGGKWGVIDENGSLILNPIYSDVLFSNDSNLIILNSGKILGKESFDEVKQQGKFGLSDKNGKLLLPIKFDEIVVATNYVFVKTADKYQIYNKQGVLVSEKKYDDILELSNKFISFRIGEKNGILNPDLKELIQPKFWATKSEYGYSLYNDIDIEGAYFKIKEAGVYFYANENGEIYKD